jgi:Tfp pilus assembly protein PilF
MDTGKRQHLQDIYATDRSNRDDFTPQVSTEALEERQREIRRHRFISFFLGTVVLLLSVSLVWVIVNEYIEVRTAPPTPTPITQEYIPRYTLPSESQWVLDFPRQYGDPNWSGEGERPFNVQWVRKAAFNLIHAEQAIKLEKYAQAAEYYEAALEILPNLEGVKVPLGMAYFKMENYEKAMAHLENTPEADLTPEVLNNLGVACIEAKAYDRSENYLGKALEMRPSYAAAQKNMAILYREQERGDEAVSAFEKYIDLRPDDIDTQHTFALYLTKLKRWEEAADLLQALTEEITDIPVLYFLLAQVEMHNDHPEKAFTALQRGIQLADPNSALAYMSTKEFDQLRESDEFQVLIKSLGKSEK